MRNRSCSPRLQHIARVIVAAASIAAVAMPHSASAGFFDFLFGNRQTAPVQAPQPGFFVDPASGPSQPLPPFSPTADGIGALAHCVRMCDGRYFPILARTGTTPTQLCQAFCPASATRVFFGSTIDYAMAANGERYSEIENAYLYRKRLSADCTCNGRDPTGLAPVDISLDTTLRPGDVVATSAGLVAYQGQGGHGQGDFTPVSDYPGLTATLRARLGEMKVAPVAAELADQQPELTTASVPKAAPRPAPARDRHRLSLREPIAKE